MITHIFLGIISILILFFVRNKEKGLKYAFFLVTLFLAIRYGWGNDYMNYLRDYNSYTVYSFNLFDIESSMNVQRHREWLWLVVNRLFDKSGLGFFGMVILFTIFESWSIYRLVEKYVNPNYFWAAILFWVLSKSFCINASMMRQFLCICIYLNVVDLMIEKRKKGFLIWSIIIIFVGSFIHRSFLMTMLSLPLFYVHVDQKRKSLIWSIIVGVLFIVWTIYGRRWLEPLMLNFIEDSEEFSNYMSYIAMEKSRGIISGLGIIFSYVSLATWLWLLPKIDKKRQSMILVLIFSYFFNVVTDIFPLAGRLSLYFSIVSFICWPVIFEYVNKWKVLYAILAGELIILARDLLHFYNDPLWHEYFYEYHTIFEAGQWM